MLPREIVYHVVIKYLGDDSIQQLEKALGEKKYTDAKFIKVLEKYFDFSRLIYSPLDREDAWIYNYLYYETKKTEKHNAFKIGESINFQGNLLKRGLILKYYKEMIFGKSTKKYFK